MKRNERIKHQEAEIRSQMYQNTPLPRSESSFTKNIFSTEAADKVSEDDTFNVSLDVICVRFENKFITGEKELEGLRKSIEMNGLANPIYLLDIHTKLIGEDAPKRRLGKARMETKKQERFEIEEDDDSETIYLKEQYNNGKRYMVVAGHRRFEATKRNFIKHIEKDKDGIVFKEIKINYPSFETLTNDEKIKVIIEVEDKLKDANKIFGITEKRYIKAVVKETIEDWENEETVYKDTNLTARSTTSFEYLVNNKKEIEKLSEFEKTKTLLPNEKRKNYAEVAREYIQQRYGIEFSEQTIYSAKAVDDRIKNDELRDIIFSGKITMKEARILATDENIEKHHQIVNEITEGVFDIKNYVNKRVEVDLNRNEKIAKLIDEVESTIAKVKREFDAMEFDDKRKDAQLKASLEKVVKKLQEIKLDGVVKKL